jgi:putative inorganic carbon (hco3(-)) transporter
MFRMPRAAFYLASGAAVASIVSIAASQILLAAALLALLLSRQRLRFPPITLPLACFVALTLVALALSSDPGAGWPQVKKFYVFLMLPVVFTAITQVAQIRPLIWGWAAAASASGLWAVAQFWTKREHALATHQDVYLAYVADRATGFLGHWMAFGAVQMVALLMLLALILLAPPRRHRWLPIAAATLIAVSIGIGWTRSVWLACGIAGLYLIAVWRPKLLLLTPLLVVVVWFVSPRSVRERLVSIYKPHGQVDSNQHRYVTMRTGMAMIRAHPIFGIGPEMPGKQFQQYLPPDIARPLPEGFYGHLHNVYLQYAAERGLPALAAFLWMIAIMLRDWWRRSRTTVDANRRAILQGSIAALLALLAEGFFEHNLGDSEVLALFWVVVAWGYCAWQEPSSACGD